MKNALLSRVVAIAAVALGGLGAGTAWATRPATSPSSATRLPADVTSLGPAKPVVRPASINPGATGEAVFTGGRPQHVDGITAPSYTDNGIDWSVWNPARAAGTGYLWLNQCNPDCAAGSYLRYPVTLALSQPAVVHDVLVFRRLALRFTGTVPHGLQRTGTITSGYQSGFGWTLRGSDF